MGLSIILRDSNGFVLYGKAIFIDMAANPKWAELDALLVGIRLAQSFNFNKVIFKMDCACIINRLCKHKVDITIFGRHIKEVRKMLDSFSKAEVKWVNRGSNKVVDFLCKWSFSNCCNLTFEMDYPSNIDNLVIIDAI
ncbi:hypothetical protein J1N35_034418 [Gossypium stocksii]|uniref:RNase H type-1 domain-containing protein n=1 Tax=Gossypium stocksii TaxID=47602 RepID=A0A9D3US38_9ROSI|nr:hypothetical protein J1N35_034418 [Gossypium stocksii]